MGLREWRAMGLGWAAGLITLLFAGGVSFSMPVAATVVAAGVYAVWR